MKIFIAITDPHILEMYSRCSCSSGRAPLGVLYAFPYAQGLFPMVKALQQSGVYDKLFLDSGAYTLNAGGKSPGNTQLMYSNYIDYIRAYGPGLDMIASFDADFKDPGLNQCNYQRMLLDLQGTGLEDRILPVVHDAVNPAAEFQTYINMGARYIAIGSYPHLSDKEWGKINWLRFNHGVSIHLFGSLTCRVLKKVMPESIDTAQYAIAAKFGGFMFWDENYHDLKTVDVLNPKEFTEVHREYLANTFQMKPLDLVRDVKNKWLVTLDAIHRMQEYLTNDCYPNNDVATLTIP